MRKRTPKCAKTCGELRRSARCAGRGDVPRDLLDQGGFALEGALVAQPLPQLDDEAPPVEVALEVEQERLDLPLVAAVVRVDADGDGRGVARRAPRVDAVVRDEQRRVDGEVGGREAERAAAPVA